MFFSVGFASFEPTKYSKTCYIKKTSWKWVRSKFKNVRRRFKIFFISDALCFWSLNPLNYCSKIFACFYESGHYYLFVQFFSPPRTGFKSFQYYFVYSDIFRYIIYVSLLFLTRHTSLKGSLFLSLRFKKGVFQLQSWQLMQKSENFVFNHGYMVLKADQI